MMIIQAYMLSDARISVNRQGGGCRAYPWDLVKRLSTMVVHFGDLRVTDAVTFDSTRTPTSFISHGRWPGSKLLEDNMADIERGRGNDGSYSSQWILRNFLLTKYSSLKWIWNRYWYFVKLCCNHLTTTFFAVEGNLIPFKCWIIPPEWVIRLEIKISNQILSVRPATPCRLTLIDA